MQACLLQDVFAQLDNSVDFYVRLLHICVHPGRVVERPSIGIGEADNPKVFKTFLFPRCRPTRRSSRYFPCFSTTSLRSTWSNLSCGLTRLELPLFMPCYKRSYFQIRLDYTTYHEIRRKCKDKRDMDHDWNSPRACTENELYVVYYCLYILLRTRKLPRRGCDSKSYIW